jgi:small GTP-binding protein
LGKRADSFLKNIFNNTIFKDTAGQEKFSKVSSYYCRGADAAIVAYDITEANSFHHLESYLEQYRKSEPKGLVIIIGTKLDIVLDNPEMRQVDLDTAKVYAASIGAVLFETSARSNTNVDTVFNYIGTNLFPGSSPLIPTEPTSSTDANNNFAHHTHKEDSCCCLQ